MKIIEQDSGLWQVWSKNGNSVGFVFDGGWKVSGSRRRKNSPYYCLTRWDVGDWKREGLLGKDRNFMRAISLLIASRNRNKQLILTSK